MDTLYSWSARRAGGRITVTHSCGRVPHIDCILPDKSGDIIAHASDGRKYVLAIPTALPA